MRALTTDERAWLDLLRQTASVSEVEIPIVIYRNSKDEAAVEGLASLGLVNLDYRFWDISVTLSKVAT